VTSRPIPLAIETAGGAQLIAKTQPEGGQARSYKHDMWRRSGGSTGDSVRRSRYRDFRWSRRTGSTRILKSAMTPADRQRAREKHKATATTIARVKAEGRGKRMPAAVGPRQERRAEHESKERQSLFGSPTPLGSSKGPLGSMDRHPALPTPRLMC
jgi:hypothetical protein